MSITRRGWALLAACAIVATMLFGAVTTASAQSYTPPAPNPGGNQNIGGNNVGTGGGIGGEGLARTGSNSTVPVAQLAVVLLVAGGFLVIVGRKRAERSRLAATS